MEAAHIIPLGLNSFEKQSRTTEDSSSREVCLNITTGYVSDVVDLISCTTHQQAVETWAMLRNWAAMDVQSLAGGLINHGSNAILLCLNARHEFARFNCFFIATVSLARRFSPWLPPESRCTNLTLLTLSSQDEPHHYQVMDRQRRVSEHTFTDLSRENISLPSPKFLAVHAAFARVLHESGAGDYLESMHEDTEDIATFASDGSTNIGDLLYYRIMTMPSS